MKNVSFAEELARVLPADVPHREELIEKAARHLELIAAANEYMNLTRISSAKDAAIKHVLDSVFPWKHFSAAEQVLDAGTGAGFPGIPLALVLPEVRFKLAESVQKKARFVESVIEELGLNNVDVVGERAESLPLARTHSIITARAVAPLDRLMDTFGKALKGGARLLLYKGPDVEAELASISGRHARAQIVERYDLPEGCGTRTMVSVSYARAQRDRQALTNPR